MEEAKGERERGRSKDRSGRGAKKREGREERRLSEEQRREQQGGGSRRGGSRALGRGPRRAPPMNAQRIRRNEAAERFSS